MEWSEREKEERKQEEKADEGSSILICPKAGRYLASRSAPGMATGAVIHGAFSPGTPCSQSSHPLRRRREQNEPVLDGTLHTGERENKRGKGRERWRAAREREMV